MECVIASYSNENAIAIDNQKHKDDFGWTDEMIEKRNEVLRLTQENPVWEVYGGLPADTSVTIGDAIGKPLNGEDWHQIRESVNDMISLQIEQINSNLPS